VSNLLSLEGTACLSGTWHALWTGRALERQPCTCYGVASCGSLSLIRIPFNDDATSLGSMKPTGERNYYVKDVIKKRAVF
jgi:hypothetical protein